MRALMLVVAVALSVIPARAQSTAAIAGPGSYQSTFTTQVVVATPADVPLLLNRDIAYHELRAVTVGSDTQPWCGPLDPTKPEGASNPRRFALGSCPLFYAVVAVPITGSSPIEGLSATEPGKTYAFTCTVFPAMRGLFVITN